MNSESAKIAMLVENKNYFAVTVLINYSSRGLKDEYIVKFNSNLLYMRCYKKSRKTRKSSRVSIISLLTTIDL